MSLVLRCNSIIIVSLAVSFGCRSSMDRHHFSSGRFDDAKKVVLRDVADGDFEKSPEPSRQNFPDGTSVVQSRSRVAAVGMGVVDVVPVLHSVKESILDSVTTDGDRVSTANGLAVDQLVAEVQAVHPSIEAMVAAWQAAAHRYPQVISLDDPMFAVTTAPASFASRDVEAAYAIEGSQKFRVAGKRTLAGTIAIADVHSAQHDVEATRQQLAEAVQFAYWEYYLARHQIDLNSEDLRILKSFRDNALSRYEAGLVTQQDVLQAEVELANLEQRQIEIGRMTAIATGRINILLRRRPSDPLPIPNSALTEKVPEGNIDSLIAWSSEHRPELASMRARIHAESSKLELAYKNSYPDPELFSRYDSFWQPNATQSELRGQVGLRFNLPVYRARLNAQICEAKHQLARANAELDQRMLEVQSEVQTAYEESLESQHIIELYSEKLIPAAEQNIAAALANYDTAKITFLDLALAQRQLIDARQRQLQSTVQLQRRLATLRRAVGGILPE